MGPVLLAGSVSVYIMDSLLLDSSVSVCSNSDAAEDSDCHLGRLDLHWVECAQTKVEALEEAKEIAQ
jgi:hypothetical protein